MSRIRAGIILALIVGQAIALIAGTLIYYHPFTQESDGAHFLVTNRTWLVGILMGILGALWTAMVAKLVLHGCERGFLRVKTELEEQINRRSNELMAARDAVIFGMARLSESRDVTTGQHLMRMRHFVEVLARELRRAHPELHEKMSDDWIADLGFSSALHDIGKVGVPDAILLKPAKLTEAEFEQIKRHTWMGGDCLFAIERRLGASNFLMLAREIAYAHHEWWNGRGYPFGLSGEMIPLSARILALADVYDALTTSRPYKPAIPHHQAVKMISERRGTQFQPEIVDAFLAVEGTFNSLRLELSSEESPRVHAEAA